MSTNEHTVSTISGSVIPDSLMPESGSSSSYTTLFMVIAVGFVIYLGMMWKQISETVKQMFGQPSSQEISAPMRDMNTQQQIPVQQQPPTQIYGQQYQDSLKQSMSDDPLDRSLSQQYPTGDDHIRPYADGSDAGYCYVGDDYNGDRKCAPINQPAGCGSNQVYPTATMCVNPNLK
jgi:hypothetical protein